MKEKQIDISTKSEAIAFRLLYHRHYTTDFQPGIYNRAGNEIIALAEQIKAERATVSM